MNITSRFASNQNPHLAGSTFTITFYEGHQYLYIYHIMNNAPPAAKYANKTVDSITLVEAPFAVA